MKAYAYDDYKSYLKAALLQKKQAVSSSRFTYDRMAKACGIQKTYLSRVLNSDASHLSVDQLYLACRFLGIAGDERSFLLVLLDYERTQVAERKLDLRTKLQDLRDRHQQSEAYLRAKKVPDASKLAAFYLDPDAMLLHMFLAVPRFRDDLRLLRETLGLPDDRFASILASLEAMQLVELKGTKYRLCREHSHLPTHSEFYPAFRSLQRLKALERIGKLSSERSYNFSVVFAATEETRQSIKTKFLALLQDIEQEVTAALSEEVYQMSFDLFDWSR